MMNFPRTVGLVSLGCSKNRVDSEILLGMLKEKGVEAVADPADAELIVVNTCGFIGPAKEESIETIFEMARYKDGGRCRLLFVTGCLTQRYPDELKAEMPEVDGFLGVNDYPRFIEAIEQAVGGAKPLLTNAKAQFFESPRVLTTPSHSAYVKISDGCDNRCAYCAIPLIRGGYRSRPYADILRECARLSEAGASELTLIAQDTSRYGSDFAQGTLKLPELMTEIAQLPAVRWLRVLYCYPDTVTERLLDTVAGNPKIANYLDLPLQHVNDNMLRRMNRRGTNADIRRLIALCKERDIAVRTTMIVGFPGETDAQFDELLAFVRQAEFARLGAFTYSPEEGTAAAFMKDQVDEDVKRERLDRLMTLQQGISLAFNEARVGKTFEVLVGGSEDGRYVGRTQLEAPEVDGSVLFTAKRAIAPGEYVKVKITGADAYDLTGEAI